MRTLVSRAPVRFRLARAGINLAPEHRFGAHSDDSGASWELFWSFSLVYFGAFFSAVCVQAKRSSTWDCLELVPNLGGPLVADRLPFGTRRLARRATSGRRLLPAAISARTEQQLAASSCASLPVVRRRQSSALLSIVLGLPQYHFGPFLSATRLQSAAELLMCATTSSSSSCCPSARAHLSRGNEPQETALSCSARPPAKPRRQLEIGDSRLQLAHKACTLAFQFRPLCRPETLESETICN